MSCFCSSLAGHVCMGGLGFGALLEDGAVDLEGCVLGTARMDGGERAVRCSALQVEMAPAQSVLSTLLAEVDKEPHPDHSLYPGNNFPLQRINIRKHVVLISLSCRPNIGYDICSATFSFPTPFPTNQMPLVGFSLFTFHTGILPNTSVCSFLF